MENILSCYILPVVFKKKARLGNKFHIKDRISKILRLVSFIKFSVDSAMSPIMVNVWDTWLFKLLNILVYHHLPKNKLTEEYHLLFCIHSASYDVFSILTSENKLIMRDKPFFHRNITSALLYLFDRSYNKIFVRILFVLIVATLFF